MTTITFFDIHVDDVREATQDDFDMRDDLAILGMKRHRAIRAILGADNEDLDKVIDLVGHLADPMPHVHTPRPKIVRVGNVIMTAEEAKLHGLTPEPPKTAA